MVDFGLARVLHRDARATSSIVGTLRYMSPEQIAGDPLDHRSDIFSLGCSLLQAAWRICRHTAAARGRSCIASAVGPVPRLSEVMPDINSGLDAAVSRAMALRTGGALRRSRRVPGRARAAARGSSIPPATGVMEMPNPRLAIRRRRRRSRRRGSRRARCTSSAGRDVVVPTRRARWPGAAPRRAPRTGLGALSAAGDRPNARRPPASGECPGADPEVARPSSLPGPRASSGTKRSVAPPGHRRPSRGLPASAGRLTNGDGAGPCCASRVIEGVRESVTSRARRASPTPAMQASEEYRVAEAAPRGPIGSGRPASISSALGALWQAADLYARATSPDPPPIQTQPGTTPVPDGAAHRRCACACRARSAVASVGPPPAAATPPAAEPAQSPRQCRSSAKRRRVVPAAPSDDEAVISALRGLPGCLQGARRRRRTPGLPDARGTRSSSSGAR